MSVALINVTLLETKQTGFLTVNICYRHFCGYCEGIHHRPMEIDFDSCPPKLNSYVPWATNEFELGPPAQKAVH